MKKIIVTGATSFIGVHLIDKLLEEYIVYAVVRPGSPNLNRLPLNSNLNLIELEIDEMNKLQELVDVRIDAFYHLAWEGARAPFRDDAKVQESNYNGAYKAMQAAINLGSKSFVGSGSQAEYGKFSGEVDETFPCNPTTEYGKAKYRAYCELSNMAETAGLKFIWTRIFSVYGKYDFQKTLIMSCLDKMKKNELMQMTECIQNWDFIYVEDVADALVKFIQIKCESGIYNVASGRPTQLKEFVEELKCILNSSSVIEYGAVPYGREGPVSFEPIVSKMEEALDWHARISFEEGICKLLVACDK